MAISATLIYRGWAITAGCLPLAAAADRALHFTGRAVAVLVEPAQEHGWADPRPQTSTISDRVFESRSACVSALLVQAKVLIDGLRRRSCSSEAPYRVYAKMIRGDQGYVLSD